MEPVFKHREGWQRFYPDLAGMGQTPGPEWMTNSDQMLNADRDFLSTLQQAHNYPLSFDVDTLSTSFEKPTLILAGRQDSMVGYWDAWQIHENYPRVTFVVLDRAGHNLQIEQETLFNALVNEWLDRVEECLE